MALIWFAATCTSAATAQTRLSIGIAASTNDTAGMLDVRETFAPVTALLATALKASADTSPLPATALSGAVQDGRFEVMLVLTSDAWAAQRDKGWRIVALSDDSEGNVVSFVARKGVVAKTPSDMKGKKVISSGTFARDVTSAVLRQNGIINQLAELRESRDPEALVYFIANGFSDIAASRDPAVLAKLQQAGTTLFYKTDPLPVYAIMASPKLPLPTVEKLRVAISGAALPADFQRRTKIRAFQALNADHAVALALFD